jgi:hypothetical protein
MNKLSTLATIQAGSKVLVASAREGKEAGVADTHSFRQAEIERNRPGLLPGFFYLLHFISVHSFLSSGDGRPTQ